MSDPNFLASVEFRSRWRHLADEHLRSIGRFQFSGTIRFKSPNHDVEDFSVVTITAYAGPNDGNIDIEETHSLNQNFIHLHFEPAWQKYTFDESSGILTVSGDSAKVGGKYTVTIKPEN